VESLTLVTRCGKTFLFVGAERTSTIFIFDITDPKSVKLESHISIAGNTSQAPTTSYNINPEPRPNVALGILDPEMMSYDSVRDLLMVTVAFSGTLGVYRVKGLPTCVTNSTNNTSTNNTNALSGAPRGAGAMPGSYLIAAAFMTLFALPSLIGN
jgi:hypothetical protein